MLQSPQSFTQWPRLVSVAYKTVKNQPPAPVTELIVKPTDFKITQESAAVHEITQEIALKKGKPIGTILSQIEKALTPANENEKVVVCCYNSQVRN